ncbi:MAG: uncharacterized protein H6Q64_1833 [Firmicutes bacterium]|nr:uncharacterized protein [Bacillota bacterium]
MKQLWLTIYLIVFMLFACPAQAAEVTQHQSEAEKLNVMGLLLGTDHGFELDRTPTRVQGAVMLVRLLGKEKEAQLSFFSHPFADVPDWADAYVGYLYAHKLTNGTGPTAFTPDSPLSAAQYMTFLLRALGYDDQAGDFTWQLSLDQAVRIGLFPSGSADQLENIKDFKRDEMVWVSWLALQTELKGQTADLIQKLVENDHAVDPADAAQAGIYQNDFPFGLPAISPAAKSVMPDFYIVKDHSDYAQVLALAMMSLAPEFTINFWGYPGDSLKDFEAVYDQASLQVAQDTGISQLVNSWSYQGNKATLTITFTYSLTAQQISALDSKVDNIISAAITPQMSEFEKEKVLHDYIVNHCAYDYKNLQNNSVPATSFTQYGVLALGKGVCQGYADAMYRLCREVGLECRVVIGQANDSGNWVSHAWNILKIGGQYYQLDVTWDDPVMADGTQTLNYNYFNLTNAEMDLDHSWDTSDYPLCSATQYNYYVYNDLLVSDIDELEARINEEIRQGSNSFIFKLQDFTGVNETALKTIMLDTRAIRSFTFSFDEEHKIIKVSEIEYRR